VSFVANTKENSNKKTENNKNRIVLLIIEFIILANKDTKKITTDRQKLFRKINKSGDNIIIAR
jgi:hypothetical protein